MKYRNYFIEKHESEQPKKIIPACFRNVTLQENAKDNKKYFISAYQRFKIYYFLINS